MKKNVQPNSLKNLKKFEPGNKAGGRKKGSVSLTKILEKMLNDEVSKKDKNGNVVEKVPIHDAVVLALLKKAMSGDISAIKEVYERIDGKVIQKNETTIKTHEESLLDLE